MQINEFISCSTFLLLIGTVSLQNLSENKGDSLEKICDNLLRNSKTKKESKNSLQLGKEKNDEYRVDKPSSDRKVSIDRKETVGQGGLLLNYNQFATDQASSSTAGHVILQQDLNLIDSEIKYLLAEVYVPIAFRGSSGSEGKSGNLESRKTSTNADTGPTIDILLSKCEKRFSDDQRNRQNLLKRFLESAPSFRSSDKNENARTDSRRYFPQESDGTEVLTNVGIAPDGDFTDFVTSATGNSTYANIGALTLFDQSHNKLTRSSGDLVRITFAGGVQS